MAKAGFILGIIGAAIWAIFIVVIIIGPQLQAPLRTNTSVE